jgi:hypothetical protein
VCVCKETYERLGIVATKQKHTDGIRFIQKQKFRMTFLIQLVRRIQLPLYELEARHQTALRAWDERREAERGEGKGRLAWDVLYHCSSPGTFKFTFKFAFSYINALMPECPE